MYFENNTVFEINTVLITVSCLATTKNCGLNYSIKNSDLNTVVLAKLSFFLCIKKELHNSFFKTEHAEKQSSGVFMCLSTHISC